jgi:peptidoglycan/xylan/chitin deacetylase (PgdA/CDA1 family)
MTTSWRQTRTERLADAWQRLFQSPPTAPPPDAERRLLILGYHRVGRRSDARFDHGVITADAAQLERHIQFFQENCVLVGLRQAIAIASGREHTDRIAVLITFDDGYLDNYEVAFPILERYKVPAVFFLVSTFASGGVIPWWDRIAWMVKSAQVERFSLAGADSHIEFDLRETSREDATDAILALFKARCQAPAPFLKELEECCRPEPIARGEELFLSWSQAREMMASGMDVGAHTHTHPILAGLTKEEQTRELKQSKRILERELGKRIDVVAYPVGGRRDFNGITERAAWDCGYRAAFSYHGGINRGGETEQFDIKRIPVYWNARPEDLLDV